MRKLTLNLSKVMMIFAILFLVGCSDDDNNNIVSPDNQSNLASVRVIHTSYDAPDVDVIVDDNVAITSLGYGISSGYAELNPGTRNIKVTPAGSTSPVVIEANLDLNADLDYTVYAVNNLGSIEPVVSIDDRKPVGNRALIRFLHASPDAPAVDIKLDSGTGSTIFSAASFKDITNYLGVAPGTYTFVVTPSGSEAEVVVFDPITVSDGGVYTVVAHGTLDNMDEYPFAVRVFVDNNLGDAYADLAAASTQIKVVHASPDAPAVDLYLDGIKVNQAGLPFPQNTGYLDIAAGTRNIMVNASGTDLTVIDADVTFRANSNYSIFAVDYLGNISPIVLMDDLTMPASGTAHVRFMHYSPDAPSVDITLPDGTIVFGDYEFKEASDFTPLPSGNYDLQVRLAGTDTIVLELNGLNLESQKIYTVFAKGLVGGTEDQALGAEIILNN